MTQQTFAAVQGADVAQFHQLQCSWNHHISLSALLDEAQMNFLLSSLSLLFSLVHQRVGSREKLKSVAPKKG